MAIKLGCRYIVASLKGITNRRSSQSPAAAHAQDPPDLRVDEGVPRRWMVTSTLFHLEDESRASAIRPDMLLYVFERQFGKDAVLPMIDEDTVVTITWSYTPIADFVRFTTKCLVRKGMPFPIVLGQRDWVGPLGTLVKFAEEDEQRTRCANGLIMDKARINKSANIKTLHHDGNSHRDAEISQLADSVATASIGRGGPRSDYSYVSLSDTTEGNNQVGCNPYRKKRSRTPRQQRNRQKQQDQGTSLFRNSNAQPPETAHRQGLGSKTNKKHAKVPLKSQLRSGCGKVWNRGLGKPLTQTVIKP